MTAGNLNLAHNSLMAWCRAQRISQEDGHRDHSSSCHLLDLNAAAATMALAYWTVVVNRDFEVYSRKVGALTQTTNYAVAK